MEGRFGAYCIVFLFLHTNTLPGHPFSHFKFKYPKFSLDQAKLKNQLMKRNYDLHTLMEII